MIIYFNLRAYGYRETVDQIDTRDFPSRKAFRIECKRLVSEYHMAGMPVYLSSRCCKNWKDLTK